MNRPLYKSNLAGIDFDKYATQLPTEQPRTSPTHYRSKYVPQDLPENNDPFPRVTTSKNPSPRQKTISGITLPSPKTPLGEATNRAPTESPVSKQFGQSKVTSTTHFNSAAGTHQAPITNKGPMIQPSYGLRSSYF